MSKKREAAYAQEDAALAADIERTLADFKEKFTAAENEKDPAKRILDLRAFDEYLSRKAFSVPREIKTVAHRRAVRTGKSRLKQTGLTLAALTVVALPVMAGVLPAWYSKKSETQKLQGLRAQLDVDGFEKTVNDYQKRVAKLLDDTVKGCDLRGISKSPHYPDALHLHEPLKRKFDAAAAARAAIGDEAPDTAATGKRKPSAPHSSTYPELNL